MTMLRELQDKYKGLLVQSEAIRLKYQGKAATMTGQEEEEWTRIVDEMDKTKSQIETAEKEAKLVEWANKSTEELATKHLDENPVAIGDRTVSRQEILQGMKAFKKFAISGHGSLSQEEKTALGNLTSIKAYQADNPAGGGYLIAPQMFVESLITLMKDLVWMRQGATQYNVARAESLGVPVLDTDPADADWTAELATGSEETTFAFGKRELRPHPLAKRVKISNKLLRQSAIDVENVLRDRLGYKFAVTEEKAFLTGHGANQPLGIFTASNDGVPTTRDVTAAGATSVAADDLINTKYFLKAQYQAEAVWVLNRTLVRDIRKLKDSTNNYLWTTAGTVSGPGGGMQGTPELLLNLPVRMSEYAPNTMTTGLYVGMLYVPRFYWIADALDMQLQVLDQLYAETNQTGYIARKETDGMPVLAEAFARLKLA